MLYYSVGLAQSFMGKVLGEEGEPLADVLVLNKNSNQHTYSNATGSFTLTNTYANDSVSFYLLGFEPWKRILKQEEINTETTVKLTETGISLDQVVLVSELHALTKFVDVDIKTDPVKSSQEILRKVPGLIIGQHAGGGKAEQLFLRGFDIDHGTDVAISADGLPVNMVSHAHGQGYADLHFVIPETIEDISFGKGTYYADHGNFNTAGYVDLHLKKRLSQNVVSVEAGQFNTVRLMGMFNMLNTQKSDAYLASELYLTDGPFDSPQNFSRINIMGKYIYSLPGDQELNLGISHFQSTWDASGQIPQRAVDDGTIGRFGAIDDTEGGQTGRSNIWADFTKLVGKNQSFSAKAYVSQYDFELYSNFTFYLEDPVNGDQIRQKENRIITGAEGMFEQKNMTLGQNTQFEYRAGAGFRYDQVSDNELSHTVNRKTTLEQLSLGDVNESNMYGFLDTEFKQGKWMLNPALRVDYFKFVYNDLLSDFYNNEGVDKVTFSPKLNTVFTPGEQVQFFLKTGIGFHSNDTRVSVKQQGEDILPKAYGADLGTIWRPITDLVFNIAAWWMYLEQEFVYVGDAGIVEPSGKSRRLGIDLGARYQPHDWLFLYGDLNYAYARGMDEPDGQDYIPLAPDLTSTGGIVIEDLSGFSGALNYRFMGDRPANEDNSMVAEGYFVVDFNINYHLNHWNFGVIIENLFDTEWNETQFATETRLFDEPAPVEDITFTPGNPFYLRGKVVYTF